MGAEATLPDDACSVAAFRGSSVTCGRRHTPSTWALTQAAATSNTEAKAHRACLLRAGARPPAVSTPLAQGTRTHLGHAAHVLHGGPLMRELGEGPLDPGDDSVCAHGALRPASGEVERGDAVAGGRRQGLLLLRPNLRRKAGDSSVRSRGRWGRPLHSCGRRVPHPASRNAPSPPALNLDAELWTVLWADVSRAPHTRGHTPCCASGDC